MRFSVDDTEYDFDLDRLTYDEAEFIFDNTGMGLWAFGDGLRQGVPKAIKALIVLGKRRAGVACRWQDIPGSFEIAPATASVLEGLFRPLPEGESEDEKGAAADPTIPGPTPGSEPGTAPASDSPATSSA